MIKVFILTALMLGSFAVGEILRESPSTSVKKSPLRGQIYNYFSGIDLEKSHSDALNSDIALEVEDVSISPRILGKKGKKGKKGKGKGKKGKRHSSSGSRSSKKHDEHDDVVEEVPESLLEVVPDPIEDEPQDFDEEGSGIFEEDIDIASKIDYREGANETEVFEHVAEEDIPEAAQKDRLEAVEKIVAALHATPTDGPEISKKKSNKILNTYDWEAKEKNHRDNVYEVEVENGYGDGYFPSNTRIEITADTCPRGTKFKQWIILSGNGIISNTRSMDTVLNVQEGDVLVKAICD